MDSGQIALAVLDDELQVERENGVVRCRSDGKPVSPFWRVLTLHYLTVRGRPAESVPAVSFAELPGGRSYAPVYRGRVIERICRTVGAREQTLHHAAGVLGGRVAPGGNAAYEFQVYPRVALRLVWYAGDDEFPPSVVLLLPRSVESFFCIEDIVVLSEGLVSRLSGGHF